MVLSPEQNRALAAIKAWIKDPDQQVFRLFGYAGTGKSTIAKEFDRMVGGLTLYAAFTGKAALVLQRKGCPATTIHKLIYIPAPKSTKRLEELEDELVMAELELKHADVDEVLTMAAEIDSLKEEISQANEIANQPAFAPNPESDLKDADLLVIDEVSMVGRQMAKDLLGFGVKILVLGDPGQLPPVADTGFFTEAEPDFMLTEVHRQASESPVLALATKVRQGEDLPRGQHGTSRVLSRGVLDISEVAAFDQVLCGTNRARRETNQQIREELGFKTHLPEEGDKLICLRNDYDVGLLNGSQWTVLDAHVVNDDVIRLTVEGDNGGAMSVSCWRHYFEEREKDLRPWDIRAFQAFDFGYVITVHKSQGSSWPNVLVIDQSSVFRENASKHLYTAITRASESVTVVR